MKAEKGIYTVELNGEKIELQYNTYTLRLLSKLFGMDLEDTFNQIGNISKSIEVAINFIIAGASSFNDVVLTEKEACNIIDGLGGLSGERFIQFITFAISVYVPKESEGDDKKKVA